MQCFVYSPLNVCLRVMQLSMLHPTPPCTEIGGDLTHSCRMCQIPHPSITIQCQIPTLYIRTRICAGTRANACAGQKPHPPLGRNFVANPLPSPTPIPYRGGVGRNIDRRIKHERFCISTVYIIRMSFSASNNL